MLPPAHYRQEDRGSRPRRGHRRGVGVSAGRALRQALRRACPPSLPFTFSQLSRKQCLVLICVYLTGWF